MQRTGKGGSVTLHAKAKSRERTRCAHILFSSSFSAGGFGSVRWFQPVEKLVLKFKLFVLGLPTLSPALGRDLLSCPREFPIILLVHPSLPGFFTTSGETQVPTACSLLCDSCKQGCFFSQESTEGWLCSLALCQGLCGHFGRSGNSELLRRPASCIPAEARGGIIAESL